VYENLQSAILGRHWKWHLTVRTHISGLTLAIHVYQLMGWGSRRGLFQFPNITTCEDLCDNLVPSKRARKRFDLMELKRVCSKYWTSGLTTARGRRGSSIESMHENHKPGFEKRE